MNEIVIAILTSSAFSTIVSNIISKMSKKDDMAKALMSLMGFEIRKGCRYAIEHKGISMTELKQLEEMNSIYHKMGGNGYVATLMGKIEKLDIISED